jgi:electron transfer flavoprotein alpha subunit
MRTVVDLSKCTGCESCLESCPYDAIEIIDEKAYINEYCQDCTACLAACPEGAISEVKGAEDEAVDRSALEAYKGVWVFAEQRGGKAARVAFELLGAGRRLADTLKVELSAVLLGADEAQAQELIRYGADKVYHCDDPALSSFNDQPYARVLSDLIEEHTPEIVLAGATPIGRSFIPRVAARVYTGLTADCTSLEVEEGSRDLQQIRPAFGGNIMANILCPRSRPQIATVRPRVMKPNEYQESRTGEIIKVKADDLNSGTKVLDTIKEVSSLAVNLQEADVIVSGGRGLGDPKGFEMLQELAELFDGTVGASRAAVDEGWIPYSHQVGQTGKTVCPKLYIACGISGAVQHLVGMQSSDIIIAINKNPDAPIFGVATFGIVGDVYEVVPMLIKKLKEAKGQ